MVEITHLNETGLKAAHKAVAKHYPGCDPSKCRDMCACQQHAQDAVKAYMADALKHSSPTRTNGNDENGE